MLNLSGRKALFIIAPSKFRDEELFETKKVLEGYGASATIASSSAAIAEGMLGAKVKPDITLAEVKVDEFDAIIFVGGSGASVYFHDPIAHSIAIQAERSNKVIAAICFGGAILSNAGILLGRKVTAFPSIEQDIVQKGGIFTGAAVEVDGNLITADGPASAKKFGEEIAKGLA